MTQHSYIREIAKTRLMIDYMVITLMYTVGKLNAGSENALGSADSHTKFKC